MEGGRTPRLVKRYGNRKLYDTAGSRYVTLEEIARWVRAGEDVKVVENDTGEDLTGVTLAQILLEEERRKSGVLSLTVLRDLIRHGEEAVQGLVARVDRSMEAIRTVPEKAGRRVQELVNVADRLAALQQRVDDTLRRSVERITAHPAFQKEIRRIERTIKALEARIARLRVPPPGESPEEDGGSEADREGGS